MGNACLKYIFLKGILSLKCNEIEWQIVKEVKSRDSLWRFACADVCYWKPAKWSAVEKAKGKSEWWMVLKHTLHRIACQTATNLL